MGCDTIVKLPTTLVKEYLQEKGKHGHKRFAIDGLVSWFELNGYGPKKARMWAVKMVELMSLTDCTDNSVLICLVPPEFRTGADE